jgi:hypothetical protein
MMIPLVDLVLGMKLTGVDDAERLGRGAVG